MSSGFTGPMWGSELSGKASSNSVTTELSIIAPGVVRWPVVCDCAFAPKTTASRMHLMSSHVSGIPSPHLFFSTPLVANCFPPLQSRVPSSGVCTASSRSSSLSLLLPLSPANHLWLSAPAAVGRSSDCITSMDFSNEIPISSIGGDSPFSLSSGKGHFPKK